MLKDDIIDCKVDCYISQYEEQARDLTTFVILYFV